jgi:hypothetical protein
MTPSEKQKTGRPRKRWETGVQGIKARDLENKNWVNRRKWRSEARDRYMY